MLSALNKPMNGLDKPSIREQLHCAFSHFQQNQFIESETISRNILAHAPDQFDALHLLGLVKFQTKDYENALTFLSKARTLNPLNIQLLNTLACTYQAIGKTIESEKLFIEILNINPFYQETLNNYLNLLENNSKYYQIINIFEPKTSHFPDNTRFLRSLAYSYGVTGNFGLAIATINQAISRNPGARNSELLNTKGAILSANQQYEKACQLFQQILISDPSHLNATINLAYALLKRGEIKSAEKHFLTSLDLLKNLKSSHFTNKTLSAKIQFMLASIRLMHGDYKEGWLNYAKRPSILLQKHLTPTENINLPADLNGKRILIIHDQGIGDEIFFLRFIPMLKYRGAHISYLASTKIATLISRNPDLDEVIITTNTMHHDYKFSVADLPLLLKCYSAKNIPVAFKLVPNEKEIASCRKELLQQAKGPLIGITWRAGANKVQGQDAIDILDKQIPLESLVKCFANTAATLVVLQRNPDREEIDYLKNTLNHKIVDYSHYNEDLEQMTALLSILDDYIGVSNTNMHLRGSLDQKATLLLPYPPEWRWQLKGDKTPWYAKFTLLRQDNKGGWTDAINTCKQKLDKVYA